MLSNLLVGVQAFAVFVAETADNYDLVILNDDDVPMASAPYGGFNGWVIFAVLAFVLAVAITSFFYTRGCNLLRARLNSLYKTAGIEKEQKFTWNYVALKEAVNDTEAQMVNKVTLEA